MDIDDELLVSGSIDNKIRVWNLVTNKLLFEFAHEALVHGVKIVDKMVLSCGDKTLRIWNLTDGNLLHKLQLPSWCYNFDLNSEKTLLAIAHFDGVSIWDFLNVIQLMEVSMNEVYDVRFNEQGTTLIVGQSDGQVSKIDLY